MPKVLFVLSASDHWTLADGSQHQSGYWADEVTDPHRVFREAGWDVVIATPGGIAPTPDAGSLKPSASDGGEKAAAIQQYLDSIAANLEHPVALESIDHRDYDAVFYPGGYGPMEDLSQDKTSAALLKSLMEHGKPLGLVCHGPAALLATLHDNEPWPFAGYRMTGFTDEEEYDDVLAAQAKWLLQTELERAGAVFHAGPMFDPNIVVDRNLHTGQNPRSSKGVAQALLKYITEQLDPRAE